jgi:hypothetical protein
MSRAGKTSYMSGAYLVAHVSGCCGRLNFRGVTLNESFTLLAVPGSARVALVGLGGFLII